MMQGTADIAAWFRERKIDRQHGRKYDERSKAVRRTVAKKVQRPPERRPVISMGYSVAVRSVRDRDLPVWKYQGSSKNRKQFTADEQLQKAKELKANAENGIYPVCRSCQRFRATKDVLKVCTIETYLQKTTPGNRCNCTRGDSRNKISDRSRGKIRDKFAAFYDHYGTGCTFATFGFINKISDTDAVAILNKFLTVLRKEKSNLQYIWVAERQHKNGGRIHFHALINKHLDVQRYNALWTLQQYQAGLIGFSRKLSTYIDRRTIEAAYLNGSVQDFFNPFDIKKVYGMDGLACYLTKYVTKNKDEFSCAAWHCSRGVSQTFTKKLISQLQFDELLSEKNTTVNKKTGEVYEARLVVTDYANLVYLLNKKYFCRWLAEIKLINGWVLNREYLPDRSDFEMPVQHYYDTIFSDN